MSLSRLKRNTDGQHPPRNSSKPLDLRVVCAMPSANDSRRTETSVSAERARVMPV